MRLENVLPIDTWMSDGERRRYRNFVRRTVKHMVPDAPAIDPLLQLLVCDLGAILVHVERTEAALLPDLESEAVPGVKELEAAGKARERMRKAMKELQDYSGNVGKPPEGTSLADRMKPILKRHPYIVEELSEEASQSTASGIQ